MTALICGSFAYDNIMVYPGKFRDQIMPENLHILNVSFMTPELRREFGGCAGNIAFSLQQMGGDVAPMGTVGKDFAAYADWMDEKSVRRDFLSRLDQHYTAQAYIITDLDDNQLTAFHPGAMSDAHVKTVPTDAGISIGMVSPDGKQGMVEHAAQFAEAGIPFFFDPGQGLPMFDADELGIFIQQASWMTVNDYEAQMVSDRVGRELKDIANDLQALIVTKGGEGSDVYVNGEVINIACAQTDSVVDPTGCGDAYRAGLLYGIMQNFDWQKTASIASVLGAIKIEKHGTQNHDASIGHIASRLERDFGIAL